MIKVTCGIIVQHDYILVTQKNKDAAQALLWEFPGGKIEPDETEEQSLVRELKEELNIQAEPLTRLTPVLHHYRNVSIELIPFICKYVSGIVELREHLTYHWVPAAELLSYNWCPADLPIVEEYLRIKEQV